MSLDEDHTLNDEQIERRFLLWVFTGDLQRALTEELSAAFERIRERNAFRASR